MALIYGVEPSTIDVENPSTETHWQIRATTDDCSSHISTVLAIAKCVCDRETDRQTERSCRGREEMEGENEEQEITDKVLIFNFL